MARKYARHGERGFIGYMCKTYKAHGKQFCSSHSIDLEDLEVAVLLSIKHEAKQILNDEDIDELKKVQAYNDSKECYEMQLESIKSRIEKIENFKKKTYDNFMEDLITKEEYKSFVAEYDKQIKELREQQGVIDKKADLQKELNAQYDEWAEAFKDYINIQTLTRDVVLELIDKIEVNADGSINIYYKFHNPYMD